MKAAAAALVALAAGCRGPVYLDDPAPAGSAQGGSPSPAPSSPPPELDAWEANMVNAGRAHCETIKTGVGRSGKLDADHLLAETYYDAQWVFLRIAEYRAAREPSEAAYWRGCADAAARVYRDGFVRKNDGKVPGFWNFSHGAAADYAATKNAASAEAVKLLVARAAYSAPDTPLSETANPERSREVAYAVMSHVNAEKLGLASGADRERRAVLVGQALGHLDRWFVTKDAPNMKSFMVALTCQALIQSYEESFKDPRIPPAVVRAADGLWEMMWSDTAQAFKYTDVPEDPSEREPAPDLNLLIAPVYAWAYHVTGDTKHRERADAVFSGGVRKAYLGDGKQFDQNYRWSFDYLRWRNQAEPD